MRQNSLFLKILTNVPSAYHAQQKRMKSVPTAQVHMHVFAKQAIIEPTAVVLVSQYFLSETEIDNFPSF